MTVALVEERIGVPGFLDDLRARLKAGTFRPLPVRERMIPKPGGSGKLRKLGIPAVADKVVQAALKLVLEPIFEADFEPVSYGFRPMRRAHDAIAEIHHIGTRVTGGCWTRTSRRPLTASHTPPDGPGAGQGQGQARARAGEGVPQGRGSHRARRPHDTFTGTPQGGILTPPTQLAISASR